MKNPVSNSGSNLCTDDVLTFFTNLHTSYSQLKKPPQNAAFRTLIDRCKRRDDFMQRWSYLCGGAAALCGFSQKSNPYICPSLAAHGLICRDEWDLGFNHAIALLAQPQATGEL
jgi:hypothetical protein